MPANNQNEDTLGTSLQRVLSSSSRMIPAAPAGNRGMLEIDLALIVPHRDNPRKTFDQDALQELAESIRTHGIVQPIVVRKEARPTKLLLASVAIELRNWRVLARVPVVIREDGDQRELAELRLIENIQRADLNPIEVAEAYQILLDEHGLTQDDLAKRVGKDRSSISNSVRLLTLPQSVRRFVADGRLSMGHARALITVEDEGTRRPSRSGCTAKGFRCERLKTYCGSGVQPIPDQKKGPGKRQKPAHIKELEDNLLRLFGRPVDVTERGGKGTMTVHFHTKGDFKRMIDVTDQLLQQMGRVE